MNIVFAACLAAVTASGATLDGPFPLLMTPYAENGDLDCETLAREAKFVADCGVNGIIWPSAGDALKYLSDDEERRGLEAIAAARPPSARRRVRLRLCAAGTICSPGRWSG